LRGRTKEKRPGVSRVTDGQAPAGSKEGRDHRGGESCGLRHCDELLIEQAHEFGLIKAVDEAPHESAQIGGGGGDGGSVSRNICQQQAGDAAGGTTGGVIDVPAALRRAVGLAVNPGVQASHFHAAGGKLASTPHFHALHVLCRLDAHDSHYSRALASCGSRPSPIKHLDQNQVVL
jgi:hypothetical protein